MTCSDCGLRDGHPPPSMDFDTDNPGDVFLCDYCWKIYKDYWQEVENGKHEDDDCW